jgi:hypothetical protein
MTPETDGMFPLTSRRRAEDILVAEKATYHIQVFSGITHGFAVRGNPEVENERMYTSSRIEFILQFGLILRC